MCVCVGGCLYVGGWGVWTGVVGVKKSDENSDSYTCAYYNYVIHINVSAAVYFCSAFL